MLHTDPGAPMLLEEMVTVGHKVMLHGCRIGRNSLVGIGAVVLNHAVIGANSLVGAGALVTERKTFPEGVLILGSPARVARDLTDEEDRTPAEDRGTLYRAGRTLPGRAQRGPDQAFLGGRRHQGAVLRVDLAARQPART